MLARHLSPPERWSPPPARDHLQRAVTKWQLVPSARGEEVNSSCSQVRSGVGRQRGLICLTIVGSIIIASFVSREALLMMIERVRSASKGKNTTASPVSPWCGTMHRYRSFGSIRILPLPGGSCKCAGHLLQQGIFPEMRLAGDSRERQSLKILLTDLCGSIERAEGVMLVFAAAGHKQFCLRPVAGTAH